jgi:hypothetical protein
MDDLNSAPDMEKSSPSPGGYGLKRGDCSKLLTWGLNSRHRPNGGCLEFAGHSISSD